MTLLSQGQKIRIWSLEIKTACQLKVFQDLLELSHIWQELLQQKYSWVTGSKNRLIAFTGALQLSWGVFLHKASVPLFLVPAFIYINHFWAKMWNDIMYICISFVEFLSNVKQLQQAFLHHQLDNQNNEWWSYYKGIVSCWKWNQDIQWHYTCT